MVVCIAEDGVPEHFDEANGELSDYNLIRAIVGDEDTQNDDVSLVYFSSGTTDLPKMIQHDFTYPLAHIVTAKYWQNVVDDGLHYTVADTGWAKSVWGQVYGQWISGSAVFVYDYERFDAGNMLKKASQFGVTTYCAPPTIYRFLIKEDLSKYNFSTLELLESH